MSAEQIAAAVGFFILVSGTLWGIWWRIEGKVDAARKEAVGKADAAAALAAMARQELSSYQTKAAETFATKAGIESQTMQIMKAIEGVASRIDSLNERLDRLYESKPSARRT